MGRRQSLLEWSGMAFWHFQLRSAHLKIACWMLILIRFLLKISFLISIICFGKVMFFSLWNILRNNRVKAACSNKGPQETGAHPRSLERTHQRSCWSEDISRRSLLKFKAWTWKKQTKKTQNQPSKKNCWLSSKFHAHIFKHSAWTTFRKFCRWRCGASLQNPLKR